MTHDGGRPAGWYGDESDAALLRYWDGKKWSPHTAPKPAPFLPPLRPLAPGSDELAGHTVRLRAPDEHTTVPLPPDDAGSAASDRWVVRAIARARRRVGRTR
ncbi:DUF2510 domain-containing protein [Agromyces sp. NPDC049794]|uniref:DUF2510 domain-containing protein n=1 Tax=unclassified Agromyces TaxID=2639701 RepID=UPI0033D28E73